MHGAAHDCRPDRSAQDVDGFVEDDADDGIALDIVSVMAEQAAEPVPENLTGRASIVASRRASVMADVAGSGVSTATTPVLALL